jgi:hypothetical protein
MSLSRELFSIAQRVKLLEEAGDPIDNETVKRFYYGKGALDYRDKLMDFFGHQPMSRNAMDVFHDFLSIFPDPYPGK